MNYAHFIRCTTKLVVFENIDLSKCFSFSMTLVILLIITSTKALCEVCCLNISTPIFSLKSLTTKKALAASSTSHIFIIQQKGTRVTVSSSPCWLLKQLSYLQILSKLLLLLGFGSSSFFVDKCSLSFSPSLSSFSLSNPSMQLQTTSPQNSTVYTRSITSGSLYAIIRESMVMRGLTRGGHWRSDWSHCCCYHCRRLCCCHCCCYCCCYCCQRRAGKRNGTKR